MKRFGMMLTLVLLTIVPIAAYADGYQVMTTAQPGANNLYSSASYNYGGVVGSWFVGGGTLNGTNDTTGKATSSFDTGTLSSGGATGTASASANLADGTLHASGSGVGYAQGVAQATLKDTLHFTVAGASPTQVTQIQVTWTMDGNYAYNKLGVWTVEYWGGLDFGPAAGVQGQGRVWEDVYGSFWNGGADPAISYYPGHTLASGWDAATPAFVPGAPGSPFNWQFTGTYDLIGSSIDIPVYASLYVLAGNDSSVDFSNTGSIGMILPANVSYTSDSGVFMTAGQQPGTVPEPGTLSVLGSVLAGFGVLRWRRRA